MGSNQKMPEGLNGKLLIHIGFHKTGSSWLQDNLLRTKNGTFHSISDLAPHFLIDKAKHTLNPFDLNLDVLNAELEQILAVSPVPAGHIPVISYERLSGSPFAAGNNSLSHALRLREMFPQARILIVIREQQSVILSGYFQYLTGGGTFSIDKYLNAYHNGLRPYFSMNHYQYHHIIKGYIDLFGKENVLVVPYEVFKKDKMAFFNQLSEFVEQKIDLSQVVFDKPVNINHHQFVRYRFRFLNALIKPTELNNFSWLSNRVTSSLSWRLMKLLLKLPLSSLDRKVKNKLNDKIGKAIAGKYTTSNQLTSELIGTDLESLGYQ